LFWSSSRAIPQGDALGLDPTLGNRAPLLPLERARRAARAEDRDAGRGNLRRRALGRADRRPEAARDRKDRPVAAYRRPGRAEPVAKPRARDRAPRRCPSRRVESRAKTPSDETDGRGKEKTARAKTSAQRDEAPAPTAGRGLAGGKQGHSCNDDRRSREPLDADRLPQEHPREPERDHD